MCNDYRNLPLSGLIKLLDTETEYSANRELAHRVVCNNETAVNYYLGVLSLPIVNYIEHNITHRDILSEFYEFLSGPFNSVTEKAEWRKVSLYKGETSRLDTYTSVITTRHFCKVASKEKKIQESETEWIDYVDYQALLDCASDDGPIETTSGSKSWKARKAFDDLSERDQMVITALVIEKKSALEAYPSLESYINPRARDGKTSQEIKAEWTDKQKQDALSLIKGRAVKMFIKNFMKI